MREIHKHFKNSSLIIPTSSFPIFSIFTFEPVGSVATVSTLPVCPRQQCLAFTLFLSEFHSHSRTVWSREAVRSREVRPSARTNTKQMFQERVCHNWTSRVDVRHLRPAHLFWPRLHLWPPLCAQPPSSPPCPPRTRSWPSCRMTLLGSWISSKYIQ